MEEGPDLLRKAGCVLEEAKPDGDDEGNAGGGSSKWEINTKDSVIDMSVVFSNDKLLLWFTSLAWWRAFSING